MKPIDVIVTLILVAIIGGALAYIIRAKRRGEKCIGCPYSKQCSGNCNNLKDIDVSDEEQEKDS